MELKDYDSYELLDELEQRKFDFINNVEEVKEFADSVSELEDELLEAQTDLTSVENELAEKNRILEILLHTIQEIHNQHHSGNILNCRDTVCDTVVIRGII